MLFPQHLVQMRRIKGRIKPPQTQSKFMWRMFLPHYGILLIRKGLKRCKDRNHYLWTAPTVAILERIDDNFGVMLLNSFKARILANCLLLQPHHTLALLIAFIILELDSWVNRSLCSPVETVASFRCLCVSEHISTHPLFSSLKVSQLLSLGTLLKSFGNQNYP